MSQFIPLPDELLHKVYGYILPIFEYAEYVRNMEDYKSTQIHMAFMCRDHHTMMYEGSVEMKLDNIKEISRYARRQKKYLLAMTRFLEKNPRFVRPCDSNDLTEDQYFRAFDADIAVLNMKRLENNITLRRGLWEYPDTEREVLLEHDIPELLFNGSVRDLIYACIINNIRGFGEGLKNDMKKRGIPMDKCYVSDIIRFINMNYIDLDGDTVRGGISFRKSLARSLMRL